jgi:hypothetical protein
VRLTVTDNKGATDFTETTFTVADGPTALASDAFGRTVAGGWGSADTGGPWTFSGSGTALSVGSGTGQVRLNAGSGPWLALAGVSSSSTDLTASFALDKPATGSGLYASLAGRRTATGEYRAKLRYNANNTVSMSLVRTTGAFTETTIASETVVSGLTAVANQPLLVRVQVYGAGPTTVRAKVWRAGTTEPAAWTKTVTDATAGYQGAGSVGLYVYLSGSASNAPITVSVDDFQAVPGP